MRFIAKFIAFNGMPAIDFTVYNWPMETKEQEALKYYNKARNKNNLPPLGELPNGVEFVSKELETIR